MKKLSVIVAESVAAVMDEVAKEVAKVMAKTPSKGERIAFSVFFGTMTKIMLDIPGDLSIEEQENILIACGTWCDIGILIGKSPQLLVDILNRANAKMEGFTPPEWLLEKERAIAGAEEILKKARGCKKDDTMQD